jgi:hypothetical protein
MYSRMAVSSSLRLRKMPRRIRLLVISANQRSTSVLSHWYRYYWRSGNVYSMWQEIESYFRLLKNSGKS